MEIIKLYRYDEKVRAHIDKLKSNPILMESHQDNTMTRKEMSYF